MKDIKIGYPLIFIDILLAVKLIVRIINLVVLFIVYQHYDATLVFVNFYSIAFIVLGISNLSGSISYLSIIHRNFKRPITKKLSIIFIILQNNVEYLLVFAVLLGMIVWEEFFFLLAIGFIVITSFSLILMIILTVLNYKDGAYE